LVAGAQVGLLSFPAKEGEFNKPYSDATAQLIDTEVRAPAPPPRRYLVAARGAGCQRVRARECVRLVVWRVRPPWAPGQVRALAAPARRGRVASAGRRVQVRNIVNTAYERTLALLTGKRDLVKALADTLLEKEVPPRPGPANHNREVSWAGGCGALKCKCARVWQATYLYGWHGTCLACHFMPFLCYLRIGGTPVLCIKAGGPLGVVAGRPAAGAWSDAMGERAPRARRL